MKSRLHSYIGTFRQLEIILAVHEHGTITAASEQLYLTQPTVSMQLKKLADAVGMQLYDQAGRKIVFTEAGLAVVKAAREVLDRMDGLDMQLADLKGLRSGTLKLGVVTTAKYFIPHLLGEFCERYPNIRVEMNVDNRSTVLERFEQGLDDLYVFSHPPESETVELHDFLPNPLVAIAPLGHRFTDSKKAVSLRQFCAEPFLMREQGSGTRHAIETHLAKYDQSPNVRMTIDSNETIKHAVMSGLGVSIVSSHTLTYGGHAGLAEINVSHLPIHAQWKLVRQKNCHMSILASSFLGYINDEGRQDLLRNMAADLPLIRPLLKKYL